MTEDTLEQKAFDDLDAIAEMSKHAIAELEVGNLDGLEDTIKAIHNRASAWEDEHLVNDD